MTRRFEFSKLHGAGNDFIFIEDLEDVIELTGAEVRALCDRHFGIGADGVIVVRPPRDRANDGFMDYVNADGSLAQMCGNGVRCFAKYLIDHGIAASSTNEVNVETRAGVKAIACKANSDGKVVEATVDMGAPVFEPSLVPTMLAANSAAPTGEPLAKDVSLDSPFGTFEFTCISMGNPHAVAFVDDCDDFDVAEIGSYFESCDAFPEKANIEFATVKDDGVHMRVYERGVGETLACGTGACATGVAAYLTGRSGKNNDLVLLGGTLRIAYEPGGSVLMTGPAVESFSGSITV